jgi:topoisomerase-4 subunit A
MKVNEILRYNTDQTVDLLKQELEIRKNELMEKILFSSLEKIFIEKRIYRDIENVATFEGVIETIDKGLKPYKSQFYREITRDDILRLMEIRIKRISKYDSFKADELLKDLEKELKQTLHHLKHLVDYAIAYYQNLWDKYGKGRERKTEIKSFESVAASEVIANNQKLYVNREDGFIGWGLKKDEYIVDCSELDDVIVIRKDGKALVSRINEKVFMGKDILHVGIWKKGDERMVYNLIYSDGKGGTTYAKRFAMPAITRDKEYVLDQGNPNSKVHYFSANPNGEAEVVEVKLSPNTTARIKNFDFDFSEQEIKARNSKGNIVTKYPVRKIDFKESRGSTLGGLELWYDNGSGRLNKEIRGKRLGKFNSEDQILAITKNGVYKITSFDLTNRYEPEKTLLVEKFNPKKIITAVYWEGESKQYFVKRFTIETTTPDKEFLFISEHSSSRLEYVSTAESPEIEMDILKGKDKGKETESVYLEEIVDVKGWKALGNRLSQYKVTKIKPVEEPEEAASADEAEEVTETVQSPKKKLEEDLEQPQRKEPLPSLFEESPNPASLSSEQIQHPLNPLKVKVEQASLFDSPSQPKEYSSQRPSLPKENLSQSLNQPSVPSQNPSPQPSESQPLKKEKKDSNEITKGYTPGDTIELEL